MLPSRSRIQRADFAEILKSRHFANSLHFTLKVLLQGRQAKFSVSVSKKVSKKAVVRNRIRRRAYSALPPAEPGLYMLIAKKGAENIKGQELRDELANLFKKR